MAFYTYILRCRDASYYVGHTDDLEKRIAKHINGEIEGYTKNRNPFKLVLVEEFSTRYEALVRERLLKGWSRAKKEALIKGNFDRLQWLSRSRGSTGSPRKAALARDPSASSGRTGEWP